MRAQKLLFLMLVWAGFSANATDLIVREGGLGGSYATISEAITASSDGDRIFIENKSGNIPYVEDLTIDKAVQFLPVANGGQFRLIGDITIDLDGGEMSILSMEQTGSIEATNIPSFEVSVNLLGITTSTITLPQGYGLTLAHSTTNKIAVRYGNFFGNKITYGMTIFGSTFAYSQSEVKIVGNVVNANSSERAIYLLGPWRYEVNNNQVEFRIKGIEMYGTKEGASHEVMNNLIVRNDNSSSSSMYPIYFTIPSRSGHAKVYNNIIGGKRNSYDPSLAGIRKINASNASFILDASYNLFHDDVSSALLYCTVAEGNIIDKEFTVNKETHLISTTDHVDAGHPSYDYYDLDLTANDMGVFGGSDSWTNYNSTDSTGSARVMHVDIPRRASAGSSIDVEAEAYDR